VNKAIAKVQEEKDAETKKQDLLKCMICGNENGNNDFV
jgi:hypothetical protein